MRVDAFRAAVITIWGCIINAAYYKVYKIVANIACNFSRIVRNFTIPRDNCILICSYHLLNCFVTRMFSCYEIPYFLFHHHSIMHSFVSFLLGSLYTVQKLP